MTNKKKEIKSPPGAHTEQKVPTGGKGVKPPTQRGSGQHKPAVPKKMTVDKKEEDQRNQAVCWQHTTSIGRTSGKKGEKREAGRGS